MGVTTRNLLVAILVASVPLAVCGFLPWYNFNLFNRDGNDVEVFTSLGDGYVVAGLAVFCGLAALHMLSSGRATLVPMLALAAAALAATTVVMANLTYDSDVCRTDSVLGFSSSPRCSLGGAGDIGPWVASGQTSIFLWWAAALGLFLAIASLALPLITAIDRGREDATEGLDTWA